MSHDILAALVETTLAASAALLLVLMLRRPVRHWLGASAAYALWLCVPVAVVAVLLPARQGEMQWVIAMPGVSLAPVQAGAAISPSDGSLGALLLAAWLAGVLVAAARFWWQQRRFKRGLGVLADRGDGLFAAQNGHGLPAVIGVLRPRVVVPADFDRRYSAEERALVLRHERTHIARGDLPANLLAVSLRCLHWFNPLVHYALRRYRLDQELACDEWVIARHPHARRTYGEAMLKTQLDDLPLPVGCHWPARHPLKERIAMLKRPTPSVKHWIATAVLVGVSMAATAYAAWAAQPAQAPAQRHDFHYRVAMAMDVDGERNDFEVREWPGRTFGIASTDGRGRAWRGEFAIDSLGADQVRIRGDITVDGRPVATPELTSALDREATVQVAPPDGGAMFTLTMTVSRQAGPVLPDDLARSPSQAPPRYPAAAVAGKQGGRVLLKLLVGTDGRVKDAVVEKSSPAGIFDEASLTAARRWTFEPRIQGGKPVEGWVRVPIAFEPDPPSDDSNGDASTVPSGQRHAWSTLDTRAVPGLTGVECDAVEMKDADAGVLSCGNRTAASR
ncbi:TonB family protein [Pseudoxanthomonas putridarboris]|uniref:TonB family protein n=1 Tax=Pseudoxanthomonas putridarboris TaxID=752605 RepID=A0ABU9J446_9GAMM